MLIIALSWVWVPVAFCLIAPSHFDQHLDPVIRFLRRHGGQMIGAVFFLIGVCLLARGIIGFTAL